MMGPEDTSLALPSDSNLRSGQQRVLSQVNSVKKNKSTKIKKGTTSSTSSTTQTFKSNNEGGAFMFRGASTFRRYNTIPVSSTSSNNRQSRRKFPKSVKERFYNSITKQQESTSSFQKSTNGIKYNRSDPALLSGPPLAQARSTRIKPTLERKFPLEILSDTESLSLIDGTNFTASQGHIVQPPSAHSQADGFMVNFKAYKNEQASKVNSDIIMSDISVNTLLEYLKSDNESYQLLGASYTQHTSYSSASFKSEVHEGIGCLVKMLDSTNPKIAQAASGALRNLSYEDIRNKVEVQRNGGIGKALKLINNTDSTETKIQLAGLLWNLSSSPDLKKELLNTALCVLSKEVVVPYVIDKEHCVDPSVFHCATGCLRNLSSNNDRNQMRNCPKLLKALIKFASDCAQEMRMDDPSLENCMCIVQNLSYDVWIECSEDLATFNRSAAKSSEGRKSPTVGCFSPRSKKAQYEFPSNKPKDSKGPSEEPEILWLLKPKSIDTLIVVLGLSKNVKTLEPCCGALLNLTCSKSEGCTVVCEQVFNDLWSHRLLPGGFHTLNTVVRNIFLLVLDNISRKPNLFVPMAKQTLPHLASLLTDENWKTATPECVETVCTIIHRLLMVDESVNKKVIDKEFVFALSGISENEDNKEASTAASKLLHKLWTTPFLLNITKKLGIARRIFLNSKTITACKGDEK